MTSSAQSYFAGGSVAYMGFLMGAVGRGASCGGAAAPPAVTIADGAGAGEARHTLRRLFAREPGALEELMAVTGEGRVRGAVGMGRTGSESQGQLARARFGRRLQSVLMEY
jgi:hypothetical protein